MTTEKVALAKTEKEMPTPSLIMMKTTEVSDDTFSFPQNDNLQILIKEERGDTDQDHRTVEVLLVHNCAFDDDSVQRCVQTILLGGGVSKSLPAFSRFSEYLDTF